MINLFFKTWKNLKLILFVPDLMLIILNVLLGNLFLMYTNLGSVIGNLSYLPGKVETLPLLENFISANFLNLILFAILFFIVNFVVGSGLLSIRYGLMRDIVRKQKLLFFEYSKEYFWNVVKLKLMVFFLMVLVILVFGVLATLIYVVFSENIAFILSLVLLVLILVILKLALLFRYPSLFLKDKSAFFAFRNSFLFLKNRFFVVIFALLVVLGVGVLFASLYAGLSVAISSVSRMYYGYFVLFFVLWQVISVVVNLLNTIWSDLFLFYVFKGKQ